MRQLLVLYESAATDVKLNAHLTRRKIKVEDDTALGLRADRYREIKQRAHGALRVNDAVVLRDYVHLPMRLVRIGDAGALLRVLQRPEVAAVMEALIELKATPVRIFMFGNRVLMPDAKLFFEPAILIGSVLRPVILLLAIILAWPGVQLRILWLRLLLAVPVIALLLVVNVPLGFVGVMLDFREYFPDIPVAPLVYWNDFMQTRGPLALAIAAGIFVGATADRCVRLPVAE